MEYFVYILYSAKLDKYYVGSTESIETHIKEHLWKHKGYTSKAKDWELKYSEILPSKIEALNPEKQIKMWKSESKI